MKRYIKPKIKVIRLDLQSIMAGSPKTYSLNEESTKRCILEVTGEEPGFLFRAPNSNNIFDDDTYGDDL